MTLYWWCVLCLCACVQLSVRATRAEEGYPTGLMSVCQTTDAFQESPSPNILAQTLPNQGPGSTKPASIPRSLMRRLFFVTQGLGRTRRKYTYWTAKNIVDDARIDFKKRTMLLAVGYLDSVYFPISTMFANLYEDKGYNVILMDNQRFATVHYHLASRLMRPVGKHVAEVLVQLTGAGLDPKKLDLLGFSLGGQTVSYIAKNYQRMTGRNISTITSLEPSGPCFRKLDKNDRLDASDADFVQVIHTNIDGFGMATKMGHVDFYINGGEYQPSELTMYPCTVTCSHFRVLALWQAALEHPGKFIGLKCNSIQQARDFACYDNKPQVTNVMGLNVDKTKHGIYFVSTSKEYPYYLGRKGLKEEFASWRTITNVNDGNETEIYA